jgi:sodium-dependent phosphate transporter
MKGLMLFPLYFWLTGSLIAMLLIWKGGDYKINLTESQIPGVIVASGAAFSVLITIFLIPWVYRIVIKEDWQLRPWHIIQGPHLLRRGDVPPPPANFQGVVRNFYDGHLTQEELDARRAQETSDEMNHRDGTAAREKRVNGASSTWMPGRKGLVGPKPKVPWYHISFLWWGFKFLFLRGVDIDIIAAQKANSPLSGDIEAKHARSSHYDNRAEFLYTFLQIMTASAASFVHGANDVSNAVGPYATIYHIWNTGINPVESNVPIWILAFGGAGIALGVWTYGYHIMSNLGNRLTLMSPSRGFCMELGSTIAIVVATRLRKFPGNYSCMSARLTGFMNRASCFHHAVHHRRYCRRWLL